MFSACFARLATSVAGLRLQFLLSTQYNVEECHKWGTLLNDQMSPHQESYGVESILEKLLNEPQFALSDLLHNAVSSGIIGFTSAFEFYLKDIIALCLKRSSSLRKQAFSKFEIKALDLEAFASLDEIKGKYIESLSSEHCKGGLFTDKIKKASSFLSVDYKLFDKTSLLELDSIWSLRNNLAHNNSAKIENYIINIGIDKAQVKVDKNFEKGSYIAFVGNIVMIINRALEIVKRWEEAILEKWAPILPNGQQ